MDFSFGSLFFVVRYVVRFGVGFVIRVGGFG